jgi:calcium-translocating P-type ATPase
MIIILICCSIFEIGISLFYIFGEGEKDNMDWVDGSSIVVAILVVVSVGSITNYKKEMKFHDLNDLQNGTTTYNIIRNSIPKKIIADDILVGDLIKINYGEILPADMLLVEGNGIKIDESSLTGESNAVSKKTFEKCKEELEAGSKNPSSMILLSGTNVIEGAGSAIAIAVGPHSQKGIIRGTIDNAQEDNKTPLEIKLNNIADLIGYFGLGSAIVTLLALIIRMIINYCTNEDFEWFGMIKNLLTIIILCVSIIVVAIPEGLPLAVTLSLAFSIKKLMDNNNLVRKMHACETMGGANVICTDKTGTLTLNLMFVTRIITSNEKIEISSNVNDKNISLKDAKNINTAKRLREDHKNIFPNDNYWDILYSAIALNVDCTINKLSQPNINGDMETFDTKNKTDQGFIEFLYQYKSPVSAKKELYLSDPENYKISPFDSKKKTYDNICKKRKIPKWIQTFH